MDFQYSCRLLSRSFLQMGRPNVLYVKKSWKPNGWLHVISQFIQEKRLFSVVSAITHQIKGTIWSYILIISIVILEISVLIVLSALTLQIKERIWRYISINGIGNDRTIFCKVNKIGIFHIVVADYRANYSWEWRFPMSFVSKNHENQKLFWKSHQDSYWWKALCLLLMWLCGFWQIKFKETY